MNALVVGVSADKPEVQHHFIEHCPLTFRLLSDTEHAIIEAYGARAVLGLGARRMTFLVAPDGTIARTWPKVVIEGHADDVVATIREKSAVAS